MTPTRIRAIAAAVGGQTALAHKMGVDPRTVRYWIAGDPKRTPSGPATLVLERLAKRHRVPKETPQ